MLITLQLINYRCFKNSTLNLKQIAVLTGDNNAGKSTVVDALRVINYITLHCQKANYVSAPPSLGLPLITKGMMLNLTALKIDLRGIVHQYQSDVCAQIRANFDSGVCVKAYLSSKFAFAVIEQDGRMVAGKTKAKSIDLPCLRVMPQLGLIREDEAMLTVETVKKDMNTRLSSRHFRNELYLFRKERFNLFRETVQSTWRGLRIDDIEYDAFDNSMRLFVYESDHYSEIGLMGSGLQMWLQMIWFFIKCNPEDTIVLDEPDVYMHPTKQIKLYEIVTSRFKQVIIATHSSVIIDQTDRSNVIIVDKSTRHI